METLTLEQIESAKDSEVIFENVPEWGGSVGIRVMSGRERDAFEASCLKKKGRDYEQNLENVRSRMLVKCLCDTEGKRLFQDNDLLKLSSKSGVVLSRLFEVAQTHNGMNDDDIEALAGNSVSGQSDDSG